MDFPLPLVVLLCLSGVEKTQGQALPAPLIQFGSGVVHSAVTGDGNWQGIPLQQNFSYFERQYSQLYLSMDGFLSFTPLTFDGYIPISNTDIIAPLWTDLDMYTRGDISYEQATNGPLLQTVTDQMDSVYPGFTASWVFVSTWWNMEFEPDTGAVTFQVVLVSDNEGHTCVMMNYGVIPNDPEPWLAGLQTQDNNQNFTINVSNITNLPSSSNVGIPGRWIFQVAGSPLAPTILFPVLSSAGHLDLHYDGNYQQIQLIQPFNYFGRSYSQLYLSMDGFLSFDFNSNLNADGYYPYNQLPSANMIAGLWTDIDTYTRGNITFEQATSGPLLQQATTVIKQSFNLTSFSATWMFVGTWQNVEFEPDTGAVTFQVVLISGADSSSYALLHYVTIPTDLGYWTAGYQTADNSYQFQLPVSNITSLPSSTNVGVLGRWAFKVNAPTILFPVLSSAGHLDLHYDGNYQQIQLIQPFNYFGRSFSQLYLSMDGFLSFDFNSNLYTDGYYPYNQLPSANMIAGLWTDIDTYTRGDITFQQATSGPLLQQATTVIKQSFNLTSFSATWVFVGTWQNVEFEPDTGAVTFQVVLISGADSSSYALLHYVTIPTDYEYWKAGYQTADNSYQFQLPVSTITSLPTSTNVGVLGRWAFKVNEPFGLFFPVLPTAVQNALTGDGSYVQIQLQQPFSYASKQYSTLYLYMDGFVSFQAIPQYDGYYPYISADIIAALWTDIDIYTRNNISYEQATSGPLINQASSAIQQLFPGTAFTAGWVFVATWSNVEFEPDVGGVTFQIVLISDGDSDVSYVLFNYGDMPNDPEAWKAGYFTADNTQQYTISVPSTTNLRTSTNVGKPGRWAFRVDDSVETCGGTNLSVSLSRCQLFEAGFSSQLLHLNDPSCTGQIQNDRLVFSFKDNECGTILQTNATNFIYKNAIQMFNGPYQQSMISRDRWLNVSFSCVYPLIQTIDAPTLFQATSGVVSKNLPSGQGTYQISLTPYADASFTNPLVGTVTLGVNQQIYISLSISGVDAQQFTAVLDSCWATPNVQYYYYYYNARWDLVTNGCPNPQDGTVQVLQNGVSLSDYFSFRMFTFTGLSNSFNLHCQVHLCLRNGGQCALPCTDNDDDDDDKGSRRRRRSMDFHDTAAISMSF
ncbi:uncharacterized protein [Hoplias malabaricus]|uniref:uncharacterized protein n=1 Tax=Hoplias malabaricus TaxID=27720 RepID=UPI0034631EB4